MQIDKFINRFLIFFIFAILSSFLYFHFASKSFAFYSYFNQSIEPKIKIINSSLNSFGEIFTNKTIDLTFTKLTILSEVPTNSSDILANAVNSIRNLIVNIVNVPLRVIAFMILLAMLIINFITLFVAIIGLIPQLFNILNVFSAFPWVGVIPLIVLLMFIVYLVWKLLEYLHGMI